MKQMTVSEYCTKYNIARNAVHRRLRKFEETKQPVNNIIDVVRIGSRTIILTINPKIKFTKR